MSVSKIKSDFSTVGVTGFVAAIGILWAVFYLYTLLVGDDLNYANVFSDANGLGNGYYSYETLTSFLHNHYNDTNGRFGNLLLTLAISYVPLWLSEVLSGLMVALMTGLILYFAGLYPGRGRGLAAVSVAAFIAVFFPWYDYFDIIDVSFNYVWAAVFALGFMVLMKRDVSLPRNVPGATPVFLFCLFAGAFHEALALPMCAGLLYVVIVKRAYTPAALRMLGRNRAAYLVAFVTGSVIPAISPGLWMRFFSADKAADADMGMLILVSAPLALVFMLLILCELLTHVGRRRLRSYFMSEKSFWFVAAVCSLPIIAAGGIIGRSGFFAQIFALIAILQYLHPWTYIRVPRKVAAVGAAAITLLVVAQMVALCVIHRDAYMAGCRIYSEYARSADGIVYCDQPDESQRPLWAWSRVRNLHIDDDFTVYALQRRYNHSHPLVLLPECARGIDLNSLDSTAEVRLSSAGTIVGAIPAGAIMPDSTHWTRPTVGYTADRSHIIMPIPRPGRPDLYYIAPRIILFGDK